MGDKKVKIFLKILGLVVGVLVCVFLLYLLVMTITDYRPKDIITLEVENQQEKTISKDEVFTITTYNIGYCGMDKDQNFFMDGGTGSRSSSKEKTMENLKGITDFLADNDSTFIFIQEVDTMATRSFNINQYEYLKENLKDYSSSFAINYKTLWVPVPILKPHGKVNVAGLVTLSKYNVDSATRYQLPGKESWPRQLAELDRCFLESRISLDNGKELVLINAHLSAYDKGGNIRKQQLGFLKEYISKEYDKGNYIVVGGDWNHLIPTTDPTIFKTTETWPDWLQKIPDDFKPKGFNWVAEESVPTSRTVATSYVKGVNFTAVIDGYLISDNIKVLNAKGHPLDFQYSDHNPVTIEIKLE